MYGYSCETFLGMGLGLGKWSGRRGSISGFRIWWGLGGTGGASMLGRMARPGGSGTGLRGLFRSWMLYGGGVLFSRRISSSEPLEAEFGRAWSPGAISVTEASDTLQRLRDEMPLL